LENYKAKKIEEGNEFYVWTTSKNGKKLNEVDRSGQESDNIMC